MTPFIIIAIFGLGAVLLAFHGAVSSRELSDDTQGHWDTWLDMLSDEGKHPYLEPGEFRAQMKLPRGGGVRVVPVTAGSQEEAITLAYAAVGDPDRKKASIQWIRSHVAKTNES